MQKLRRFRNIALLIVAVLSISLMGVGYSIYVISGGNNNDIINVPVDKVEVNNIENVVKRVSVTKPITYDNKHGVILNDELYLDLVFRADLVMNRNLNYSSSGLLFTLKVTDLTLYDHLKTHVCFYQDFISLKYGTNICSLYQNVDYKYIQNKSTNDYIDCFSFDDNTKEIYIHIPASPTRSYVTNTDAMISNTSKKYNKFSIMNMLGNVNVETTITIIFNFNLLNEDNKILYKNFENAFNIELAMEMYD